MSAASAAVANHAQDAVDHGAGTDASGADDGRRLSVTRSSIGWDDDVKMAEQIRDMLPYQAEVRRLYNEDASTIGVAILILINFIISAVEKQINPEEGTRAHAVIAGFEIFFAAVFGLELLVNMYAYWFTYFWKSGWNVFDFLIVTITFISMANANLPGVTVLRLFRAFRVFRLFKRVESLRIIIEGVGAALPGVGNAFVLLGLLMGIWAIIGVEFFGAYATEEFGNFLKALFTMWQVMTLDGWASGIARALLFDANLIAAAPFFISFTFIAGIVMTNVVVAILLEKYLNATADAQEQRLKEKSARNAARAHRRASRRASMAGGLGGELRGSLSDGGGGGGGGGADDGTVSVSSRGREKDRKLEKEDLISMLIESLSRKHLQGLEMDEVVTLAALLWHHPALREFIPDDIKNYEPKSSASAADPTASPLKHGIKPAGSAKSISGTGSTAQKGPAQPISILLNLLHRTSAPLPQAPRSPLQPSERFGKNGAERVAPMFAGVPPADGSLAPARPALDKADHADGGADGAGVAWAAAGEEQRHKQESLGGADGSRLSGGSRLSSGLGSGLQEGDRRHGKVGLRPPAGAADGVAAAAPAGASASSACLDRQPLQHLLAPSSEHRSASAERDGAAVAAGNLEPTRLTSDEEHALVRSPGRQPMS